MILDRVALYSVFVFGYSCFSARYDAISIFCFSGGCFVLMFCKILTEFKILAYLVRLY